MPEVDRILVSVLQRAFQSITEEMSISLTKTTRSPILCEAKDFVTGLYDGQGRMLEQTENLPILSFSLGPVCKHIAKRFRGEVYPGDVFFHNDVFSFGNQNNDVAVFKPIFVDEDLVAWSACKGHQADIGGAVPGGYNPAATEVWQEALRIPAVKVCERGRLRRDVWDLIFSNIRLDIVQADLKAQIGACTVGERRVRALVRKYGRERFDTHKEALFASTRRMMEAEIRTIPEGRYRGEAVVSPVRRLAGWDGKRDRDCVIRAGGHRVLAPGRERVPQQIAPHQIAPHKGAVVADPQGVQPFRGPRGLSADHTYQPALAIGGQRGRAG